MKIVLTNAPPRSGKDFISEYAIEYYGGTLAKFAEPIKGAATAIYCGGDRALFNRYDTAELKDIPQEIFFGKTCRQVQIAISEQFLKVFHGDWIFGRLLINDIKRKAALGIKLFFVSDSGFKQEAVELVKEFGAESLVLVRIHRPGFTYAGDSRSYINLDDQSVLSFDVDNDSSKHMFQERIKQILTPVIGA